MALADESLASKGSREPVLAEERTPLLSSSAFEASSNPAAPATIREDGILVSNNNNDLEVIQSLLDQKPHDLTHPTTWASESRLLASYSLPLTLTYLLQYSYAVTTIFVAGHVSPDALAAASIGVTTMTIIGYAIFEGMATALDTLCAQAYGRGDLVGVGRWCQHMACAMVLVMVPVAGFWCVSPWVLGYVVRQKDIAVLSGRFLQVSVLGLPGYAGFETMKRFVQAQGNFRSSLMVLLVCAPVNVALNWVFVFKFGWGLVGTALASALTNNLRPVLLAGYVISPWGRWARQCWGGWDWKGSWDVRRWGAMVRLSTAGAVLNLSEWCAFEILTFSSSYISTSHIAAQTILTTTEVVAWHVPFSVSVAVSTRVGHLVGAGSLKVLRRVVVFYAFVFVVIGVFNGLVVFALSDVVPRFFTQDGRVQEIASRTMPVVATFQVIDSIIAGSSGTLRGFGRQSVAAWAAFPVNYLAAVPVALWLELGSPALGLTGCWSALQCGMIVIAIIEIGTMKLMSWQKCVEDAHART